MIKINLLDSVTERQAGTAVTVERKIANPNSRLLLMTLAVLFLMTAFIGWDIISTQMRKTAALAEVEEQKRIAVEMEAVMKEMKELEAKIQNIDTRIAAIKKLRDSQAGPSAVLEAMRERISMVPGLYLESIEQTGEQLVVKGSSEDEAMVTRFGSSLEFSGGLFSNLNIETQRKDKPNQAVSTNADAPPKQEIVGFTIRCAYTPSKAGASKNTATTASNAAEQPKPAGTTTLPDAVRQQLPKPQTPPNGSM